MAGKIEKEWQRFAYMVLPADAGLVQRREMKRAFFGGAWTALTELTQIGEPEVTEVEGVESIELLLEECRRFNALVVRDKD